MDIFKNPKEQNNKGEKMKKSDKIRYCIGILFVLTGIGLSCFVIYLLKNKKIKNNFKN